MWGEKAREIASLKARLVDLTEQRDKARTERNDARANRKRIQDLYDDLLAEAGAKPQETADVTPATATPEAGGQEERRSVGAVIDRLRTKRPPAEAEVWRQLHIALSRADALESRLAEVQAAHLSYAREAYDRSEAARKAQAAEAAPEAAATAGASGA